MQQPGASWPSLQVAYVVSWLKEAQMKPRWTSGPSAESWDSIRAGRCLLCWSRSEAFGPGQSLPEPASPPLLPDSKRHARTLLGEECLGRRAQGKLITHRAIALESLLHNRLTVTPREWIVSGRRHRYSYVVNFQYPHCKTKTADGRLRLWELHSNWLSRHVQPSAPSFLLVEPLKALDSFDTTNDKSNKTRLFAVDWPITLSVLSRGIVLIISLDRFSSTRSWEPWETRSNA